MNTDDKRQNAQNGNAAPNQGQPGENAAENAENTGNTNATGGAATDNVRRSSGGGLGNEGTVTSYEEDK